MLPDDLQAKVEKEILAGLPLEQDARNACLRNLAYYNLRGAQMIPRRDAETDTDYRNRPKRSLPITRRVVDILCSHLYSPGPSRTVPDGAAATKWLAEVYSQNLMNSLWQRADRLSTLNGVAAFQIASTGKPARPISVQLWSGWNELYLICDPDDCNAVASVVTIDCRDEQTRYTWWTEDWYRVYLTKKLIPGQTADGRTTRYHPELSGPNPYGVLPFAFLWFELPTSGLHTVEGLGNYLSNINAGIDVEASDMAQAVVAYHAPIPVAYDCDVAWQPILGKGKWLRVNTLPTDLEAGPKPRLEFLQPQLDIAGGWANIQAVIEAVLEGMGAPLTAYRMDQATLPSGAALLAEQKPLLDRAKERMEPFKKYESDLAAVVLAVGGRAPGKPLSLTWPSPSVDFPSSDRDEQDAASIALKQESHLMVVMRRFGMSRDQALAHVRQIADDEAETSEILAEVTAEEAAEPAEPTADETTVEADPEMETQDQNQTTKDTGH